MFSEIVGDLQPIFQQNTPCIKQSVFMQFLDVELERAERYGTYVSLLVFRLANGVQNGEDPASQSPLFSDYAYFLKNKLRRTDYLACMEEETLAVVLLNSKLENTHNVLERLQEDSSLYLKKTGSRLKASSSVYPSEANSRETLCEQALSRLSDRPPS